jgi:methyltransferase (TIGR00027 family)
MKQDKTSQTAQYMAFFRALESTRPKNRRLFYDPYAKMFLNNKLKIVTFLSHFTALRNFFCWVIQQRAPGALSSGIARTKLIDELLIADVHHRTKQLIILGAGFDTRAMRFASVANLPVIEIDHPNTSRYKRAVLKAEKVNLPENVAYTEIDFNNDDLAGLAHQHHIDFDKVTTFIWEGVTNYLTEEAIDQTFEFISRFKNGSSVIFTYVHTYILTHPDRFEGGKKLLADLNAIEEKWTFGFLPGELSGYLQQFGLKLLRDNGAATYRAAYLPERNESGYEFYRVAHAAKV